MTTTYDADLHTEAISTPQYDDPDTYTVAEAWASSLLGEMGDDYDSAAADTADDRNPGGSRAKLFAALASGIIGGATLGAVLFGYKAVAPPTVVVPGFGVSTEQLPAAPSTPSSPQKPAPAQTSAPVERAVPNPIAPESKTNDEVAAVPNTPLDPGTPPVATPPLVIDVFVPPLGDKPEPPAPEPPKPQPPVFDPPVIDAVPVPDEPDPPVFNPGNLDVAQLPQPEDGKSRWQINPDVTKEPSRMENLFPKNDEPKRTQINTNTGSRFNVKINP